MLTRVNADQIFKRILTEAIFLLLTMTCFAQADTLSHRKEVNSAIKASLDGSILYPGAGVGIEIPIYSIKLIRKMDKPAEKLIIKDRFVSLNAGWYHHPDYHDNLYLTLDWIMRSTRKSGFFMEFTPGLGYSRTFLGGTTYREDNNGNIEIIKSAGYSYAVAEIGAGLGYSFSELKGIPLSVYWDFNILTMFPYNNTMYFRPVMELGVIYRPSGFIPVTIKKKVIKK
jgi:hypothetical protein